MNTLKTVSEKNHNTGNVHVSYPASTSCSSVKLWKGIVIAGYGTGQIRLYEGVTGILHAEVNAHARWIYSLDIAPFTGLVGTADLPHVLYV